MRDEYDGYYRDDPLEAQQAGDLAIVACRLCGTYMVVDAAESMSDCGTRETWRAWFSAN